MYIEDLDGQILNLASDSSGNKYYFNSKINLHRLDGPAFEYKDGSFVWYKNNELHRIGGPTTYNATYNLYKWYVNGRKINIYYINGQNMSEIKYYCLDTETTGTSVDIHEITQISIIRCLDRFQLNKYIKAEYPEKASYDALKYTNRTYADLFKGDPKESVVEACNSFFNQDGAVPEERCIIGHNIWNFDKKFLHALWNKTGQSFPANLWLDTIPYIKEFIKKNNIKEKKYNLNKACELVGVKPREGAHNALIDTQNNYMLWVALKKEGISALPHIKRASHNEDEE